EGAITLPDGDYEKLAAIYSKRKDLYWGEEKGGDPTKKLVKKDLEDWRTILRGATVNPDILLLQLGDELSDRGNCDIFMLEADVILPKKGLKIRKCMSNHTFESVEVFERGLPFDALVGTMPNYCKSRVNMQALIDDKVVDRPYVDELYKQYRQHFDLIACL